MNKVPLLIACGVLEKEIRQLLAAGSLVAEPRFLDGGLCCDFRALARALGRALMEPDERPRILVFGLCHPAIDAIAARHGARRVPATNCISLLIGEEAYAGATAEGSYFLLPGWAADWRRALVDRLGLAEPELRSILTEELAQAVYLDTGVIDYPARPLAEFFASSGLSVERRTISLAHLEGMLLEEVASVHTA